jgi:tRNA pseudouridine38-40 synthase
MSQPPDPETDPALAPETDPSASEARVYAHGVRLHVAYDGTDFAGFQAQPGQRTVQAVLHQAIDGITTDHGPVRGASRTDAGVHALDQVAAFACDKDIAPRGWLQGINRHLPKDVVVRAAAAVDARYDPRFDARGKHYRYRIQLGWTPDPLARRHAWWVGPGLARRDVPNPERGLDPDDWLDLDAMTAAAAHFLGTFDFRAFSARGDHRENRVRTLTRIELRPDRERPDQLVVDVHGTAFLKHMVRILVGTLVDVGRGRRRPESIPALLGEAADRTHAGVTAPPHGLTLVHIDLGRLTEEPHVPAG